MAFKDTHSNSYLTCQNKRELLVREICCYGRYWFGLEREATAMDSALVDYFHLFLVGDIPNGRKVHLFVNILYSVK